MKVLVLLLLPILQLQLHTPLLLLLLLLKKVLLWDDDAVL